MTDRPEFASHSPRADNGMIGAQHVLGTLRAATSARHELLHLIMPLSVDSVALSDYLAHLTILREWLEPLAAWLETFSDGPQSSTLARMNRLAVIDADLSHESVDSRNRVRALTPKVSVHWGNANSVAYRWGVCYVIEGSQLGGAVLYARLKDRLAPHPLDYLGTGRDALGARWQAFYRAMASELRTPAMLDDACRGAADAFDRLIELAQDGLTTACVSAN